MPSCCGVEKDFCLSSCDHADLARFVRYTDKMFHLKILAGGFGDCRPHPKIPGRAVALTLLLGEVVQIPSMLQLQQETDLAQWQRWVGYGRRISDDAMQYVSERMDVQKLRKNLYWINRKLKRGKAFEGNKINGLLMVSLDANEQFHSDHRCCEDCLVREITTKDALGNPVSHLQYYHKQVYAQLSGQAFNATLDFEPMVQGEEECAAALRLLRRMREIYGPRFLTWSWSTPGTPTDLF